MYDLRYWVENGLTVHVSNVLKSCEITLKKVTKAALISGTAIACFSNLVAVNATAHDAQKVVLSKNVISEAEYQSSDVVRSGVWAELLAKMENWTADPNRVDIDIDPII